MAEYAGKQDAKANRQTASFTRIEMGMDVPLIFHCSYITPL
ncbi:hypothetical protein PPIS_a4221 [Pseudoalteromonas piscicida]|uniref:Uncharacterized protein n=1 Tax=Pseudoalteromonas piscicida TaxID=43662 RepID=A0ABN5CHE8_PSEO7|nr:hypothetical protein PPIS_a4221 [Pseudoalteromonas piscicida]